MSDETQMELGLDLPKEKTEEEKNIDKLNSRLEKDVSAIMDPNNRYIQVYKNRFIETTKELQKAYERIAELEMARDEILGLASTPVQVPEWLQQEQQNSRTTDNIPVVLASDWHYGENVDPKEVPNGNSYNPAVSNKRIETLTTGIISKMKSKGKTPKGIVVCFLGDDISGDIHEELKETNSLTSMDAVIEVAGQKVKMLTELQKEFGNVWVISVPGNHGRNTIKMTSKSVVSHNYDSLVAMMVSVQLKNNPNITFYTPKSGEAYFKIYDTTFLAQHGDRIGSRGGQGFIGPSATIARGQQKTRQSYAHMGSPVDWLLIGHFHVPMQLEHTIANGTLVGYNQYARDLRVEPAMPSQTLFMVNPVYGVVDVSKIYVCSPNEMTQEHKLYRKVATKSVWDSKIVKPPFLRNNRQREF